MVELKDIDKIKEIKEQSHYSFTFLSIIGLFLFLLGIAIGICFSDFFREIFKIPSLSQ